MVWKQEAAYESYEYEGNGTGTAEEEKMGSRPF
jgi:hypothetical protein